MKAKSGAWAAWAMPMAGCWTCRAAFAWGAAPAVLDGDTRLSPTLLARLPLVTLPAGATLERYRAEGLTLIPGNGLLATVIPGAFDAWMQWLPARRPGCGDLPPWAIFCP